MRLSFKKGVFELKIVGLVVREVRSGTHRSDLLF